MKLTDREKVILSVFGLFIFLVLAYYLIAEPQLNKLKKLSDERARIQAEVVKAKEEISADNRLHKDYEILNKKIEEKTEPFYPDILQDKIIVILDDIVRKTQIKADSINYTPAVIKPLAENRQSPASVAFPIKELADKIVKPANNTVSNNSSNNKSKSSAAADSVEEMTVNIQFTGSYEQLISYVKEIEALNKTVVIESMSATKGKGIGLLTGNMVLNFYAIPKLHEQDKQYFEWPYQNAYGKDNPYK